MPTNREIPKIVFTTDMQEIRVPAPQATVSIHARPVPGLGPIVSGSPRGGIAHIGEGGFGAVKPADATKGTWNSEAARPTMPIVKDQKTGLLTLKLSGL